VLRPAIVKVEAEPRRRRRPLVVQLRQAHHLVPLRLARKRGGSRCCWCWRWAGAASRWISFQRPRSLQCHTVTCHSKVTESESGANQQRMWQGHRGEKWKAAGGPKKPENQGRPRLKYHQITFELKFYSSQNTLCSNLLHRCLWVIF
jgi:hypothetical protein